MKLKNKLLLKHLILPIFFLLISACSFAQSEKVLLFDKTWQTAPNYKEAYYHCSCFFDNLNRLQGPFNCYTVSSDALVKQYNFLDDKLHGEIKEFYENGAIKLLATYQVGLPVGDWIEYDEKGREKLKKSFDDKSRIKDGFYQETSAYDKQVGFNFAKKEEPPIYSQECMLKKIDEQKYLCSDEAIQDYLSNPPIPPSYKNNPALSGKTIQCVLSFRINDKAIVDDVEIIESTGDAFLDELAKAHVLNMVPFESAKEYGTPINFWKDVIINFTF